MRNFIHNKIRNFRWVILQGAAVMIIKAKRDHYIFKKFRHIFDSNIFKDFSTKMVQHLNVRRTSDPDK